MNDTIFKTTYYLEQQTPMIHFQSDEDGATLRASEVKPKLDRFIIEQYERENQVLPDEWYASPKDKDNKPALKYKMRFTASSAPIRSNTVETDIFNEENRQAIRDKKIQRRYASPDICKSYFGNMVEERGAVKIAAIRAKYKETVFYSNSQPVVMTTICTSSELQEVIDKHIAGFFLLHNFGTRQNKGFGSFKVTHKNKNTLSYHVGDEILRYFSGKVYKIDYRTANQEKQMDDIREIYQLMKSGVNNNGYARAFIYEYFHNLSTPIGNEKSWMKQQGIAPITQKLGNERKHEHIRYQDTPFQYVRAMLGVGDNISFMRNAGFPGDRERINISNDDIQRCASPILFKVINNQTFILPSQVNKNVLNVDFKFRSNLGTGTLKTPKSFDMVDFMEKFVDYINGLVGTSKIPSSIKLRDKIEPVKGGATHA